MIKAEQLKDPAKVSVDNQIPYAKTSTEPGDQTGPELAGSAEELAPVVQAARSALNALQTELRALRVRTGAVELGANAVVALDGVIKDGNTTLARMRSDIANAEADGRNLLDGSLPPRVTTIGGPIEANCPSLPGVNLNAWLDAIVGAFDAYRHTGNLSALDRQMANADASLAQVCTVIDAAWRNVQTHWAMISLVRNKASETWLVDATTAETAEARRLKELLCSQQGPSKPAVSDTRASRTILSLFKDSGGRSRSAASGV